MASSEEQKKAQAAWDRIEALGGHGVWESDFVVVSFNKSNVTDEDLILFQNFPFVQTLNLSDTEISDEGLAHLQQLPMLEELNLTNTKTRKMAIEEFRRTHPNVTITTEPLPGGTINPFTGEPF